MTWWRVLLALVAALAAAAAHVDGRRERAWHTPARGTYASATAESFEGPGKAKLHLQVKDGSLEYVLKLKRIDPGAITAVSIVSVRSKQAAATTIVLTGSQRLTGLVAKRQRQRSRRAVWVTGSVAFQGSAALIAALAKEGGGCYLKVDTAGGTLWGQLTRSRERSWREAVADAAESGGQQDYQGPGTPRASPPPPPGQTRQPPQPKPPPPPRPKPLLGTGAPVPSRKPPPPPFPPALPPIIASSGLFGPNAQFLLDGGRLCPCGTVLSEWAAWTNLGGASNGLAGISAYCLASDGTSFASHPPPDGVELLSTSRSPAGFTSAEMTADALSVLSFMGLGIRGPTTYSYTCPQGLSVVGYNVSETKIGVDTYFVGGLSIECGDPFCGGPRPLQPPPPPPPPKQLPPPPPKQPPSPPPKQPPPPPPKVLPPPPPPPGRPLLGAPPKIPRKVAWSTAFVTEGSIKGLPSYQLFRQTCDCGAMNVALGYRAPAGTFRAVPGTSLQQTVPIIALRGSCSDGAAVNSTVAAAGTFIRDSIPISVYMAIQGQALTGQGLTTLAKLGPQGGFVVDANLVIPNDPRSGRVDNGTFTIDCRTIGSPTWVITGFEMDYALVPEDSAAALIMPVFNFLRIQCGEPYSCSP